MLLVLRSTFQTNLDQASSSGRLIAIVFFSIAIWHFAIYHSFEAFRSLSSRSSRTIPLKLHSRFLPPPANRAAFSLEFLSGPALVKAPSIQHLRILFRHLLSNNTVIELALKEDCLDRGRPRNATSGPAKQGLYIDKQTPGPSFKVIHQHQCTFHRQTIILLLPVCFSGRQHCIPHSAQAKQSRLAAS